MDRLPLRFWPAACPCALPSSTHPPVAGPPAPCPRPALSAIPFWLFAALAAAVAPSGRPRRLLHRAWAAYSVLDTFLAVAFFLCWLSSSCLCCRRPCGRSPWPMVCAVGVFFVALPSCWRLVWLAWSWLASCPHLPLRLRAAVAPPLSFVIPSLRPLSLSMSFAVSASLSSFARSPRPPPVTLGLRPAPWPRPLLVHRPRLVARAGVACLYCPPVAHFLLLFPPGPPLLSAYPS